MNGPASRAQWRTEMRPVPPTLQADAHYEYQSPSQTPRRSGAEGQFRRRSAPIHPAPRQSSRLSLAKRHVSVDELFLREGASVDEAYLPLALWFPVAQRA